MRAAHRECSASFSESSKRVSRPRKDRSLKRPVGRDVILLRACVVTALIFVSSVSGLPADAPATKNSSPSICDNGQSDSASIKAKGGGITIGKSEMINGTGTLTLR